MQALHATATPATTLPTNVPTLSNYSELLSLPLLLLGVFIGLFHPAFGICATVLMFGTYAAETAGEGLLARVVPRRPSVSVLAAIPSQRRELRRVIVITALDSPVSGQPDRHPLAWLAQRVPRAVAVLAALAVLLFGLQLFDLVHVDDRLLVIPAFGFVALLTLAARPTTSAQPSVGQYEDVDLLETIVSLCARVRSNPAHWIDVWCLAVGGGSVSGEGLRQFIRDNHLSLDTTYFVNLIPHDESDLKFALAEGPLWRRRSSPSLIRVFSSATKQRPGARQIRTTLAAVPISMGYQAITLATPLRNEGVGSPSTHVTQRLLESLSALDRELLERNRMARLARPNERRTPRAVRPPQS